MTKRDHKRDDSCPESGEQTEGQAHIDALSLLGKYRRPGRSLDGFLREKHQEIDEEERKWEKAHPALGNRKDEAASAE